VGSLAMSLVLTRWSIQRRTGPTLFGAVAVYGLATLVFGLSTDLALSLAALAIAGAADMVSVVIRQTLVQLETPDEMRGRVSSVSMLFIGASNELGEACSGVMVRLLGPVGAAVFGRRQEITNDLQLMEKMQDFILILQTVSMEHHHLQT
jgi:MFS family permease